MSLRLSAPAKINLFLHITGRRADGYHTLQTVFQLLDICDTLEFTPRDDQQLQLYSNYTAVSDDDNLVIKAARALQAYSHTNYGADIRLHKTLPSGAGLGGGSSDAATTLLGLNTLWQLDLSLDELATIGLQLGADVPVFIYGRNAWAEGVGDILTPVDLPCHNYLLVYPACSVPTAAIFSDKYLTRDTSAITLAAFLEGGGHNDCEAVVRRAFPEVDNALKTLAQYGQFQMTGTGSTLFCQVATAHEASAIQAQLPITWQSFIAKGVAISPCHNQLGLTHKN